MFSVIMSANVVVRESVHKARVYESDPPALSLRWSALRQTVDPKRNPPMSLGLQHLFTPPAKDESRQHAVERVGSSFASWDDLVKADKLAARLDDVQREVDSLQREVRPATCFLLSFLKNSTTVTDRDPARFDSQLETCQASTSLIVTSSLERTSTYLDAAQALSFERYELADLLASLKEGAEQPLTDKKGGTLRSRMGELLLGLDEATVGREYLLVLEELLRLQ